jgi:hypothetical protein
LIALRPARIGLKGSKGGATRPEDNVVPCQVGLEGAEGGDLWLLVINARGVSTMYLILGGHDQSLCRVICCDTS